MGCLPETLCLRLLNLGLVWLYVTYVGLTGSCVGCVIVYFTCGGCWLFLVLVLLIWVLVLFGLFVG